MCLRIWIKNMKSNYVEELRYALILQNEKETDIVELLKLNVGAGLDSARRR